jgi:hypothetical protein
MVVERLSVWSRDGSANDKVLALAALKEKVHGLFGFKVLVKTFLRSSFDVDTVQRSPGVKVVHMKGGTKKEQRDAAGKSPGGQPTIARSTKARI